MEIKHLKELCASHLVKTIDKRFNPDIQRNIALKREQNKAVSKGIIAILLAIIFVLFPDSAGDIFILAGRIIIGVIALIEILGTLAFVRKFSNFGKNRSLDEIQAFYSSIFLQTTDKYRTTPRDRNRSLKKALNDNLDLFPYPLIKHFTKDGYKNYLYEWNEVLRMYPLWKIDICAIRLMVINVRVGSNQLVKIEIDYRVEEKLKTFSLYNALVDLRGVLFLISPFPYSEE